MRAKPWTLKAIYDTPRGRKERVTYNLTHEEALDRKDDLLAHVPLPASPAMWRCRNEHERGS